MSNIKYADYIRSLFKEKLCLEHIQKNIGTPINATIHRIENIIRNVYSRYVDVVIRL